MTFFNRSDPFQCRHADSIRTIEVDFHLFDEILIGIELQMVVETRLIIAMATFHFTVMSGSSRSYQLMLNPKRFTEGIERMLGRGRTEMSKFEAMIGLNHSRNISEEKQSPYNSMNHILCIVNRSKKGPSIHTL